MGRVQDEEMLIVAGGASDGHPFRRTAPRGRAATAGGTTLGFYLGWAVACGLAETIGLAAAAGWWTTMDRVAPDPTGLAVTLLMVAVKALAGVVEGGLLGTVQAVVLRRRYPALDAPAFMVATILVAAFGWAVGSAIPAFLSDGVGADSEPSRALVLAVTAAGGAFAGATFGGVQALVLRHAASGSRWWVAANAAGWAAALPLIYAAASAGGDRGWAGVLWTGLGAGVAAGLIIGAVTGLTFWTMRPRVRE